MKYQNKLYSKTYFVKLVLLVKLTLYGRQTQFLFKWKTTSSFWKMEDNLDMLVNGRQPQCFGKWKTTSMFWQME
jgi:hypothetical protein